MADSRRILAPGPPPKPPDLVFSEGGKPSATPCIIPTGLTPSKSDPTSQDQTQIAAAIDETLSIAAPSSVHHTSTGDPPACAPPLGEHFDGFIGAQGEASVQNTAVPLAAPTISLSPAAPAVTISLGATNTNKPMVEQYSF